MSATKIRELFESMNARLAAEGVLGEVYVLGGAVMTLAFAARQSTNDVGAVFVPKELIHRIAREVGADAGVDENWLNDAVKGFLSDRGQFEPWREQSHLKVFMPAPEYLFAMKCLAFRLGPEFRDAENVRFLLRHLKLTRAPDALAVVERYIPADRIPPKTRFALEELLSD